jgi:hypothetical protein
MNQTLKVVAPVAPTFRVIEMKDIITDEFDERTFETQRTPRALRYTKFYQ